MSRFKKLSHTIYECKYHVVICPKYRHRIFKGEIGEYAKGKLSLRLFQRYERVGKRYWGRHLWSRGYCVSTVGLTEELIRRYVKHQEKMDKQIEGQQKGLFK